VEVKITAVENGSNGSALPGSGGGGAAVAVKPATTKVIFETDEGPRADTSLEALAKLKPAFHAQGQVTAGNSSQMSDGAAAAIVMSAERARALGARPLARFVAFATAGVLPEEFGIGPAFAIPKALQLAGLKLEQIDVIELNEAFAAQALAVIKVAGLDPERVNVNGGAVALGHPLGCTGAKLTASILRELQRRNARYGLVTMCVGGGMGAAGIFERL
jgi:acetyl-CoA acyltransferase